MAEELVHSDLGASSTERWFNCPGSVPLTKDIPEPPSSVYADEGSCAHQVVSNALQEGNQAWFYVGERYFDHEVTEEMAEHCQKYLNYVEDKVKHTKSEMLVEREFKIEDTNNELWGTSDCTLLEHFGVLEVIDFKYGRGRVVEVVNNTQAMYYGLGAYEEFHDEYSFTSVLLTIVQPRAYHQDGPIRSWLITVEEILAFKHTLLNHVQATKKPDAALKAGDWCRWCKGASVCPEMNRGIQEVMQVEFQDLDKPAIVPFNPEEVSKALLAIPRVKSWINAVNAAALHLAGKQVPIPGFKVVRSRKNRAYKDKETVEKYLKDANVPNTKTHKLTLRTPKQVIAAVSEKIGAAIELMVHTPEGVLQIAPECDARPQEKLINQVVDVQFKNLDDFTDKTFGQPHHGHDSNFKEDEFEKEFGIARGYSLTQQRKPETTKPSSTLVQCRSNGTPVVKPRAKVEPPKPAIKKQAPVKTSPPAKKGKPKAKVSQPTKAKTKPAVKKKTVVQKKPIIKRKSISQKGKLRKSLRRR